MKLKGALSLLVGCLLLMLGVPVVASLYLDANGLETKGSVVEKAEWIAEKYARTSRRLQVSLRYRPRGAEREETSTIDVGEDSFDALSRGAGVRLRYQPVSWMRALEPWAPATRLAGQRTSDWLRAVMPADYVRILLSFALGMPLFVLWLRRGRRYFWFLLLYLAAAAGYWLTPVSEPAPTGPTAATIAKVRYVHRIERILTTETGNRRSTPLQLIRPMELVELEFVPEGRTEPVVATDKITADTLPGLKQGGRVEITYQKDRPRVARMNGGKRDYGWTNLATVVMPWTLGFLFVFGGGAVLAVLIAVIGKLTGIGRKPLR